MKRSIRGSARVLLVAGVAAIALFVGTAGTARADYGTGSQYQVEISANNVQGGSFWFWAALGPGQESDYQNTDCIHTTAGGNPPSSGGQTGATHTSGALDSWSNSAGMIEMDGVKIVGGLATANFYVHNTPHSSWFGMIVTSESAPIFPTFLITNHVMLQWSGQGVQVQVAP